MDTVREGGKPAEVCSTMEHPPAVGHWEMGVCSFFPRDLALQAGKSWVLTQKCPPRVSVTLGYGRPSVGFITAVWLLNAEWWPPKPPFCHLPYPKRASLTPNDTPGHSS